MVSWAFWRLVVLYDGNNRLGTIYCERHRLVRKDVPFRGCHLIKLKRMAGSGSGSISQPSSEV